MLVQLSRVIQANIYRGDDAPVYRRGNRVLIGVCCMNIVVYLLGKAYYMWRNKTKADKWNSMTKDVSAEYPLSRHFHGASTNLLRQEQENYLATTTDTGSKRLNVRFSH
jgi:hypothetical protein